MRYLKTIFILAIVSVLIFACVPTTVNMWDDKAVAQSCKIEHDNFKKVTTYRGPNCSEFWDDQLFIRAWKKDGSDLMAYQIYVSDHYKDRGWRFYKYYYDEKGDSFKTLTIDREVSNCSKGRCWYNEHIGITVTKEYLETNRYSGIRFKISGSGGKEVFYIPAGYVSGFLSVTES